MAMNKEGIEYISNFIKSMICDENIVRIMKQNNALEISSIDFFSLDLPDNINGFFCEYSPTIMIKAYDPFLGIIKDMVERYNMDVDRLLEEAEIYSLQQSIFKSYIQTGHVRRDEKPILGERDYEKSKFIKGIVNILLKISEERDIFILINNANQMCDSTLNVIKELGQYNSYRLKVLVITNEMGNIKGYIVEELNSYIKKIDSMGLVLDWPFEESEAEGQRRKDVTIVLKNSEEELTDIWDMFYTYAIDQAEYYMNMIYQKVELDKVTVTGEYRIHMFNLYIYICIFKENFSYALVLCDKLKMFNGGILEDEKNFKYYYYKSMANMFISNEEDGKRDAERCYRIAEKMDNEFMIFEALILKNMAQLAGWKNIWICERIDVPDRLIELCYKYNYMNHLAHMFVYCFDNEGELYSKVEDVEERIPNVTKGIWLAKKIGNEQFLVEAYRKCVMSASCKGYFATANYFYMKSVEIVKKNNNRFEEANIYNGLGYNCCTADKYSEANRYYNLALEIFYEEKSNDYILETLYNMGTNAILAGDFTHALEHLLAVNNILKVLKKNTLRVCNISKVFGLTAVAAFKQGNYYMAQLYVMKSERFLKCILDYEVEEFHNFLWSDDLFLYFYVSALIAARNEKYGEALELFDKAEKNMIRSTGSMFFNYVHFAVDKAKLLQKIGRYEESINLCREARKYFNAKGNFLRVRMFDEFMNNGKWEYPPMNMAMTSVTIDKIMDNIRVYSIESEAKIKRQQLRFFGTFQEIVNHEYDSIEDLIKTLITNFQMNFSLDSILFISCENEKPELKFSDLEYTIKEEEIERIVEYFKSNTSGFAVSKFSNNYRDYDHILKIFDRSKIFSVIGAPIYRSEKLYSIFITFIKIPESWNAVVDRLVLDEDDMDIYMIVFRQIIDAIEKYRLNEQIIKRAVTDELTGLYNRNGYYDIIDNYLEQAAEQGHGVDITIMYMDLDHFKYYNDTFGHHVGDALLIEFANIFRRSCENYGNVVRFGGDEFLIILDTVEEKIVSNISDNIYRLIEEADGFTDVVRRYKIEGIDIPKSCRATCSIGIEFGKGLLDNEDFSELQKHADVALYYGKNNGRGRAVTYSEIKDKI